MPIGRASTPSVLHGGYHPRFAKILLRVALMVRTSRNSVSAVKCTP